MQAGDPHVELVIQLAPLTENTAINASGVLVPWT